MARAISLRRKWALSILAWVIGIVLCFPVVWTALTSFKTEGDAIAFPPAFLGFHWTLESYAEVQERSDYAHHALNSIYIAFGSTAIALCIGIPAAWAMVFAATKRTKLLLVWMLSTKMMPAVGVLVPIYILFRDLGLLDTVFGLICALMLANLPIVIWMLYSYFREIPREVLEASRIDGARLAQEIVYVLAPMAIPGIASTILLNVILTWNEAFWTLNLTAANSAPLTALVASYSSPEGLFWAKLSAASMMAMGPILVIGWFSQKQLVRGLTFGAVK